MIMEYINKRIQTLNNHFDYNTSNSKSNFTEKLIINKSDVNLLSSTIQIVKTV